MGSRACREFSNGKKMYRKTRRDEADGKGGDGRAKAGHKKTENETGSTSKFLLLND